MLTGTKGEIAKPVFFSRGVTKFTLIYQIIKIAVNFRRSKKRKIVFFANVQNEHTKQKTRRIDLKQKKIQFLVLKLKIFYM